MPEKVYTKFGNAEPATPPQSTQQKPHQSQESVQAQPQGSQTNGGIKRARDGSPKAHNILRAQHVVAKDSKTNISFKKQKTTAFGAQGKPAVSGVGAKLKYINGISPHKNASGAYGGQKKSSQYQFQKAAPQHLLKIRRELEKSRQELPIWSRKADIRWALKNNDILLLNGETGSGKSTQTPQFLCTEPWCKKRMVKITKKDGTVVEAAVGGMIAITQPRRVAAITLAHRVAREMGSSLEKGTKQGEVGYSVRFDTFVPAGTKIKFLTEGMLLQEMLRDPDLRQYSAVIVDEIHERSVDVDLIAGFLRRLLHSDKKGRGGIPLKVVVMSATLDMGGLEAFFGKPEMRPDYKPGTNHGRPIAPHLLQSYETEVDESSESDDTYSSWSGFSSSPPDDETSMLEVDLQPNTSGAKTKLSSINDPSSNQFAITNGVETRPSSTQDAKKGKHASTNDGKLKSSLNSANPVYGASTNGRKVPKADDEGEELLDRGISENGVAVLYVTGRQYEVVVKYEPVPAADYLDKILRTICTIHLTEPLPGDILCFLTGQEEIEILKSQLEYHAGSIAKNFPRMKILPLYGSLSPDAQQEVFEKVREKFTRKIVLATNIAETSVTVSGVKFVVDCGKAKVKQFRPRLGMESLLVKPISATSAIQRQGRAGRESKGKCFRIYTEDDFAAMEEDEKPEIMRSDVIEAVLKMKARGVEDILAFPLMDRPEVLAMEKALMQLHAMGAIDDNGELTNAGRLMASFPLPAAYGRVIVEAAKEDCLLLAIDVISCITSDAEVYLQPKSEEQQIEMEENRKLIQHPKGDILTYLNTMQKYAQENADRAAWCQKYMVSPRAMRMALSIRRQLRQICLGQNLLAEAPPPDPQPYFELTPQKEDVLLKTFVKAFLTKTAVLGGDGSYSTTVGRNTINIHPSSVLHGRKMEAIMFLEHVYTTKSYAKKVSAIQANWIENALGI
jgi:ATP-dependent RNA helicase DHR2